MNLFKKKLTEQEAAAFVISGILQDAQSSWPALHKSFKDFFHEKFKILDENMAPFDLSLAAIAQEMQALKNIFPKEQAERIEKWIFKCMVSDDWGEYAIEEVKQYRKKIQSDIENIKYGSDPMTSIPGRLLQKWLGNGIRNFEGETTGIISPILLLMTSTVMQGFLGRWKQVKEKFKVVEADMPLANSLPLKDFKENEKNTDGKLNENLLEKTRSNQNIYKIIIKGPWDGIKEQMWELDDATVKNFVDENNRAYAVYTYENGEGVYNFLAKKLWMNLEEVEAIMGDPKLSKEQKHTKIQQMLK